MSQPPPSGNPPPPLPPSPLSYEAGVFKNTSGLGVDAVVPEEIRGWNWGAFFFSWIWAIAHKAWWGVVITLVLIPVRLSIIGSVVCGIKGNEWAWRNNHYDSLEHFREVQRKWAIWGGVFFALFAVASVGFVLYLMSGIPVTMQTVP